MTSAIAQAQVAVFALPPRSDDGHQHDRDQRGGHGLELRLVREDHERRHEQDPAAHAQEAACHPRGESQREQADEVHQKTSTAADATSRTTKAPATARSEIRCWRAVPARTPSDRRCGDEQAVAEVDVAVRGVGCGGHGADDRDGRERGARGLPLLVAEPQDQERHDDRSAAHSEQPREHSRGGGDGGEAHRGILRRVLEALTSHDDRPRARGHLLRRGRHARPDREPSRGRPRARGDLAAARPARAPLRPRGVHLRAFGGRRAAARGRGRRGIRRLPRRRAARARFDHAARGAGLQELGEAGEGLRGRARHARAAGDARPDRGQGADHDLPLARRAGRGPGAHPPRGTRPGGGDGGPRDPLGPQGARDPAAGPGGQGAGRCATWCCAPACAPRCSAATT